MKLGPTLVATARLRTGLRRGRHARRHRAARCRRRARGGAAGRPRARGHRRRAGPGSWLFASDDARHAPGAPRAASAGPIGRDGARVRAGRPLDRLRGRHHAPLRRLGSGFFASIDGGSTWRLRAWKSTVGIFRRQLPAAIDAIVVDPRRPLTVYAVTHGVLRRSLERRRLVGGRERGAAADPRHPLVTQPAARGGPRRHALLRHRQALGTRARCTARSTAGPRGARPGGGLPPVVPGWSLLALAGDATRARDRSTQQRGAAST